MKKERRKIIMSVPSWKRKPNEMNLFIEAQEFAIHILKITRNQKIFKKEYKVEICKYSKKNM